ncbi:hypothetical protein FH972_020757 [Carpinus fangiana]|uniref:glucan endo-1,3-beta-D-glucosidase n=1 Tax=Carpinus fangiana TaxID=176857 RepID=A0A5N6RWC5_9ROSI|nr:hypothetical protein FH972_020757 [Carpinus fangiana]
MALFWVVLFSAVAAISSAEASLYNNGVCYGPSHNGVPDLAVAISHYRKFGLTRIRLMEYDEYDVGALHAMGFEVSFGVNNDELQTLASSYGAVEDWFEKKVENIIKYNYFVINYIVVGDEAIPGPLAQYVLPVVASLIRLFQSKNKPLIKVTAAVSPAVLSNLLPPSKAEFTTEIRNHMVPLVYTLAEWGFPLMIKVYPYKYYAAGLISKEFATFTARHRRPPVFQDGNLSYWNMFDVMVDSFLWAMEKEGVPNGGSIVVGETGWPSAGNGNFTTPKLARTYNQNFLNHITSKDGTPKRPYVINAGFVYSMFDDNLKPEGAEQHFGISNIDYKPAYHLVFPNASNIEAVNGGHRNT